MDSDRGRDDSMDGTDEAGQAGDSDGAKGRAPWAPHRFVGGDGDEASACSFQSAGTTLAHDR